MVHKIVRDEHGADFTRSKMYISGVYQCEGVEDEYRAVKVHGETRFPEGTYPLKSRISPKFSKHFYSHPTEYTLVKAEDYHKAPEKYKGYKEHELIWIDPIPGFNYALIHWGNTDDDTEGCYIVGTARGIVYGQQGVIDSKSAYMKMYPKLMKLIKAGPCFIEVTSINQSIA